MCTYFVSLFRFCIISQNPPPLSSTFPPPRNVICRCPLISNVELLLRSTYYTLYEVSTFGGGRMAAGRSSTPLPFQWMDGNIVRYKIRRGSKAEFFRVTHSHFQGYYLFNIPSSFPCCDKFARQVKLKLRPLCPSLVTVCFLQIMVVCCHSFLSFLPFFTHSPITRFLYILQCVFSLPPTTRAYYQRIRVDGWICEGTVSGEIRCVNDRGV